MQQALFIGDMYNTEKYFIDLTSKYVNSPGSDKTVGESAMPYEIPYENVDKQRLIELVKIHHLSALIYTVADEKVMDADLYNMLQKGYFFGISKYNSRNMVFLKMLQLFEVNRIDSVVVKGCFINRYYPEVEVRSMSDIDILIKVDSKSLAKKVLTDAGFEYVPEESEESVLVFNYCGVNIEVHSNLVSEGCLINGYDFNEYFSNPFEHTVKSDIRLNGIESEHAFYLEDTYNLVYMVYHIAKHFYQSGCGVRMLLDLPLFIKKANVNYERFVADVKKIRLYDFSVSLFAVCREWYAMDSVFPKKKCDENVLDFIINGGVYGFYKRNTTANKINHISNLDGKKPSYVLGIIKWAFPSPKLMRQYSGWYRKKPAIFLPLAYVERMIRNVKERGGLSKVVGSVLHGKKDLSERNVILESVGLK